MKKYLPLRQILVWVFLLTAVAARADNSPSVENRFLFVIDTASAMRGYSNVVQQAVVELLNSDMKGELREGDTIGIWTYNDKLHPEFPMQVWSRKSKNTIVSNVADFLRGHPYDKRAHLDKILPALQQVIKDSEKVTILFVFDGSGAIQGTPFDTDINDLQKQYAHELRAAHLPFITVLVARNGTVFDYTINYPGLVVIPHTAEPEPPPVTNAPVVAVAPAPPPKPQRKIEIIMSGKTNAAPVAVAPAPVLPPPAPAPTPVPVVEAPKSSPPVVVAAPVLPEVAKPVPVVVPASVVTNQPAAIAETPPVSPPPRPAPVIPTPMVAPSNTSGGAQIALFIMAFSLLTIAVVLVVFLVRRFRGGSQPSLISQSIDRTR